MLGKIKNSKFCKYFERYWRFVLFLLSMFSEASSLVVSDSQLKHNLCFFGIGLLIIIMIPHIVNDTLEALFNGRE